jgi:hypothetical protein
MRGGMNRQVSGLDSARPVSDVAWLPRGWPARENVSKARIGKEMSREQVIATLRTHESELKAAGVLSVSVFGSTIQPKSIDRWDR